MFDETISKLASLPLRCSKAAGILRDNVLRSNRFTSVFVISATIEVSARTALEGLQPYIRITFSRFTLSTVVPSPLVLLTVSWSCSDSPNSSSSYSGSADPLVAV